MTGAPSCGSGTDAEGPRLSSETLNSLWLQAVDGSNFTGSPLYRPDPPQAEKTKALPRR